MEIKINKLPKGIALSIPLNSSKLDVFQWKSHVLDILKLCLTNKQVYLITLTPQRWSIGYEIGEHKSFSISNKKLLVSLIAKTTPDIVEMIIDNEEFDRSLIRFIILNEDEYVNNSDVEKYAVIFEHPEILKDKIVFAEDDGKALHFYNYDEIEIKNLLQNIANNQTLE